MESYVEYHQHWLEVQGLLADDRVDNALIAKHLKSLTDELGSLEAEYANAYDRFETL